MVGADLWSPAMVLVLKLNKTLTRFYRSEFIVLFKIYF